MKINEIKRMRTLLFLVILVLILGSCKTYYIATDSFRQQMATTDSSSLKGVHVNNPLGFNNITYSANQIEYIKCNDKNGQIIYLKNSPSIEMRVTEKNGKRSYFYFDRVILKNDVLIGGQSRFINSMTKKIPLDNIELIEVQDGRKNFNYK